VSDVTDPSVDDDAVDLDEDDEVEVADAPAQAATAAAVCEHLVKSMVEQSDAVSVDVEEGGRRSGGVTLNVHVAQGDMGRVIGKRGRIAHAIRTVVRAAAVRDDVAVDVEFVE
jgi:predicted RNA-binding protein YlqC (UPF0109 family)